MAEDGLPAPGATARTLGARPGIDIVVDKSGMVRPGTGGVSVSPGDPRNLPRHRRPPEFGGLGRDPVWRIRTSDLGPELAYEPDPRNPSGHGFVEPAYDMPYEAFQAALEATRDRWELVDPAARSST